VEAVTEQPHGARAEWRAARCSCGDCRAAHAAYEKHRVRETAYGRWRPFVDAASARAHVEGLQAAGMGWRRVARTAGLTPGVVRRLVYGNPGRAPSQRIRPDTAAKILAVTLDLADRQLVDAAGTRRRIQALVAIGWSQTRIATRLDMLVTNLITLSRRDRVTVAKRRAVAKLYDELWNVEPPAGTRWERISVIRAQNLARREGWPRPMDWDDDRIDDPTPTQAERATVAHRMAAAGASVHAICRTLRADRRTVLKILEAA
jgi:hypothetical protein